MTAREYLVSQLQEQYAEPTSVQTRKGLAAYAIRMHKQVPGYSIDDVERVARLCGCGDDFILKCTRYISEANDFMNMASLIQIEFDD